MGDLAYDYLTCTLQRDFPPQFPDWSNYPSLPGDTSWNMGSPSLGHNPEQPPNADFTMPSPSYVTKVR